MKKILLLLLPFCSLAGKSFAQPATAAPTPPSKPASSVISVYGSAFTNVAPVNTNPNWGQQGFTHATTFTVDGNEMLRYPNFNYQGIEFPVQNLNTMDTLHLDIWTPDCDTINITIVAAGGGGERLVGKRLTLNAWNSINIPLSDYRVQGNFPTNQIFQFKFERAPIGGNANLREIFVDNLFFFTDAVLPTLSNFVMPAKMLGDAPFSITPPTSNSSGAFTYVSSNTTVATIEGDVITILKAGSSIITANQAADASFAAGSISSTLVVSVPPLSTNPPPPNKEANKVISLFSDTYPNVPVTTWRTDWSGAGPVEDIVIDGNNIKKYNAVDFVGIELPPIDVTLADSVHVSVWTPSAASFAIKLVNLTGPNNNEQRLRENIVRFNGLPGEHFRPRPEQGQWNVISLPLSLFATPNGGDVLTNRNQIFQILFVGEPPFADNTYYIDDLYFSSTDNILPVKLTAFTAAVKANTVVLNWETATEINNRGFAVERSKDGRAWSELTFVNSTAPNGGGSTYSSVDFSPLQGMNFYRLRQMDFDGKFSFSSVKQVNFNGSADAVSVYPNPARGTVNVLVDPTSKKVNYNITNAMGRSLKSGILLSEGNVNKLNLQGLPAGVYMLQVTDEKGTKTTRLVVQ